MKKDSKETIQKELQELGSSLKAHSGKEVFGVPGDYFEKLPAKISNRISKHQPRNKWIPAFAQGKLAPVFASLGLIFIVFFSFLVLQNGKDQGYLVESEELVFDEYFATLSEYDNSLIYVVVDDNNPTEADPEQEQLIEYILEMNEYNGLNTKELIVSQESLP